MRLSRTLLYAPTVLVLGFALLALTGCGDGTLKCYPVSGQVLINGQPKEGVAVIYHPLGEGEQLQKKRPFGKTGPDGRYLLTSYRRGDGAPPGEYKVTAVWVGPLSVRTRRGERPPIGDRLGGLYARPERTDITRTVQKGTNEIDPIELQIPTGG